MSLMKNLGILLSGRGSNFEAIADNVASGKLDAKIAVVISNRADAPGIESARRRGLNGAGDSVEGQAARGARSRGGRRAARAPGRSRLPRRIHAPAVAVVCAAVSQSHPQHSSVAAAGVSRTRRAEAGLRLRREGLRAAPCISSTRTSTTAPSSCRRPCPCSTPTTSTRWPRASWSRNISLTPRPSGLCWKGSTRSMGRRVVGGSRR